MLAGGLVALLAVVVGVVAAPASAQTVEIPLSDVVISGPEGSVTQIGSATVEPDLVGRTCSVLATVKNQSSVHVGNTLIVASGGGQVTVAGIEDEADGITAQGGTLTLGSTIEVSVMFGPDGFSSLGSSLTVTCEPLPTSPPPPPVPGDPPFTG